eukprot:107348_1
MTQRVQNQKHIKCYSLEMIYTRYYATSSVFKIMMEYYAISALVADDKNIFGDYTTPNNELIAHCLDEMDKVLYDGLNLNTKGTIESCYGSFSEFKYGFH